MAGETQSVMTCAEFESLLGNALDQALPERNRLGFQAHAANCPMCGPLLKEAEAGRNALKLLAEIEPPTGLVSNILLRTSGVHSSPLGVVSPSRTSWWEQFIAAFVTPVIAVVRQPRFVMSFGMAFFSVSICLSLAGIKLSDLRSADLRPSAIKRNYYETSGRVVKYYENIRVVYEFQARLREFKRITEPAAPQQPEDKSKDHRNDNSGRPDPEENRDYSLGDDNPVLAEVSLTAATPRRSL